MPTVHRENIEWCDLWIRNADADVLPRLLCLGDSITRGYQPLVEQTFAGRYDCARLATSRSTVDPALPRELALVLEEYRFAVIHFNNGLHGGAHSDEEYRDGLRGLVALLRRRQPGARLIWATTTPVRVPGDAAAIAPQHRQVLERNRLAAALMAEEGIATNDLFAVALANPAWTAADGVHYNEAGCAGLAAAVCACVDRITRA